MPTSKTRINVSVSDEVNLALKKLAQRDQIPTATKAERLLELAMEIEEDQVWDQIAQARQKTRGRYLSHKQVWK